MVFIDAHKNLPVPIVLHNLLNSLLHGIDPTVHMIIGGELIGGAFLLQLFLLVCFVAVFFFFFLWFLLFFLFFFFFLLQLLFLLMFFDLNWIWNILHSVQAMMIELPVIARRNDGNAAIIDDNQTGLLFDTPEVCFVTLFPELVRS